jgi:nitroimidazol reductase NimA-like FMN-containing flavoprotein (pyridoxamine 5'-phosphate oxidase superfamily)
VTVGVGLSRDEAWKVIAAAHTGILTTLRRDGVPMALPVWFVARDERVYVRTPARSKKTARVIHDRRASFLVESGDRWAELEAVHLTGRVEVVDDPDLVQAVEADFEHKYAPFRTPRADMPAATRDHYDVVKATIRFVADDRIISWDNRRLGFG